MAPGPRTYCDCYCDAAYTIAERLATNAIWHRDRCTWVGPGITRSGQRWGICYESVGPDLYAGNAGIALFLAEAGVRLGHAAAGITARAAIRLAVEQCVDMVGGLYSGQIGVLVAAVRISNLLNDDGLDAVLQERLDLLARAEIDGFDLLSGKAGAIIGLISLAEMTKREDLLERAICLAQELIQAGCSSHRGVFWRPPGQAGGRPLLGLSHGIAGAALALLRLYERAGDESIRRLVERALAYEDSFYNPSAANWPDLRYAAGRGRSFAAPFQSMWCHGAPGIAISRLHATRLLGHEVFRRDLTAAVATTRRSIEVTIETDPVNFCLCHGIAGNADIF